MIGKKPNTAAEIWPNGGHMQHRPFIPTVIKALPLFAVSIVGGFLGALILFSGTKTGLKKYNYYLIEELDKVNQKIEKLELVKANQKIEKTEIDKVNQKTGGSETVKIDFNFYNKK